MRAAYQGEIEGRGRADQSVTEYHLIAPVCLVGEAAPSGEHALLERVLCAAPSKDIIADASFADAMAELQAASTEHLAAALAVFSLQFDAVASLANAKLLVHVRLTDMGETVPRRVMDNLFAVFVGIDMYLGFADECGVGLTLSPEGIDAGFVGRSNTYAMA